jgi:lipoic acid synthetase
MILGKTCTRNCRFCNVASGKTGDDIYPDEGKRIAEVSEMLALKYVVLTSVDRDDMHDKGAGHFARCISAIKERLDSAKVEVLTPDFDANEELIKIVLDAKPDVFAHNIETVKSLQAKVRDARANYKKSLKTLRIAKELNPEIKTKSSILLGMGEQKDGVLEALKDLRDANVDAIVMGQYLQPSEKNIPVAEYITPEIFREYEKEAKKLGFEFIVSEPFARTSYKAEKIFK